MTYLLSGADGSFFSIDKATGQIKTDDEDALDYEHATNTDDLYDSHRYGD